MSRVGRYKYNKKLGIANRIANQKVAEPIANPLTGEVMAEAGQVISPALAREIEDAGVNIAFVEHIEGKIVKVISNAMVDISKFVDFDAKEECDIKERVRLLFSAKFLASAIMTKNLKRKSAAEEMTSFQSTLSLMIFCKYQLYELSCKRHW